MIGLNQQKIKTMLAVTMGNIGVVLDPEQPINGVRFVGMGNGRKATVFLPDEADMSNETAASTAQALADDVVAGLKSRA